MAVVLGRISRAAKFGHGGHEIDDVANLIAQRTRVLDPVRPVGDERRGDAALVIVMLVHAERCVAGVGPAAAITDAGSAALPHRGQGGTGVQDRFDVGIPVAAVPGSMRAVVVRIFEL